MIHISSVAAPICQEGHSERTFPILAFSSRFFLFFATFSGFFPSFSRFLTIFSLSRGTLCPPCPYTGYATDHISEMPDMINGSYLKFQHKMILTFYIVRPTPNWSKLKDNFVPSLQFPLACSPHLSSHCKDQMLTCWKTHLVVKVVAAFLNQLLYYL